MAHDILIVDDEADIRMLIAGVLKDEGYATRDAANSTETLRELQARQPTLVILDIWLQDSELDGIAILRQLRSEMPSVPVVMISGHGTIETAVEAIKIALLRRENEELRLRAGGQLDLVGASLASNQLRQQIERVAPTGSRVLIAGAPGVGKEVVGRLLHARSRRSGGPFVAVNCATMHPDRLELELFGCETALNGSPRKIGTFERAHGGTLFLDEVADMPLETQGKIVRVLQEQTFERVGGSNRVEVDVRVVASTNRELGGEIAAGRFREDLFYRLNVVPIRVPALRERREDIPLMARHFMARASEAARLTPREFGEDAMAALQAYTWPGNVRQLRNVIDWLLIMAPGDAREPLRADMLPNEITAIAPTVVKWDKGSEIMTLPLRDAREVFEREYLIAQVTRFGGNISRTAAFVGMERSALHRKLKSLGVFGNDRPLKVGA